MNPESRDDTALWAVTQGALHLPAVTAAIRLGIPEALSDGPLGLAELMTRTQLHERPVLALGRLLASLGLLELAERISLTPAGRKYLLRSSNYFWGPLFERMAELPLNASAIECAAQRDDAALYAQPDIWAVHAQRIEPARQFARGAHCRALATATHLARSALLRGVTTLLDVAGGMGTYSVAFAEAHPKLEVFLLDIEVVCQLAEAHARARGVGERMRLYPGDMFELDWPTADVVFLSDVLHDWPPERCRVLLQRALSALAPGGRVLLNEVLLSENGLGPSPAVSYDLAMLLATQGGRQYRASELGRFLSEAGFRSIRTELQTSVYTLISATKPV